MTDLLTNPWFYAAAIPAVMMIGLSKGGLAGLGVLAVPIMSLAISPVLAAGLTLPILVISDVVAVVAYRRNFDLTTLKDMLPAAVIGIGLGWVTAAWVSDDIVRLIVGVISVLFALNYWFRERLTPHASERSPARAGLWGTVAGYTSFVSHSGGAPFQLYVLPRRFDPPVYAGTSVLFFAIVNAVKLVPYYFLGQLQMRNLEVSAVLAPIAIVAALLAVWVVKVVDPKLFYGFTYVMVFVIGMVLVGQAAVGLL